MRSTVKGREISTNPFDDHNDVDNNYDEVDIRLLSAGSDAEPRVDHDARDDHALRLIKHDNAEPLPRVQRMVASVVRFMDPAQTVSVMAAMVRNANLESLDGYSAVKFVITTSTFIVVKEGMEGVNAMARQPQPFRYHCALGGGSFAKGLLRDAKRKAMIAVPIAGAWVGLGFARDAIFNWAMSDPMNRRLLILGMFYLDGPALRTFMVGLLTMIAYEKGQQLVAYCSPLPYVPSEPNQQTRWYQDVLKGGTRIFYGVVAGEFLRELCNTVIGFTYLFQTRISLMTGPYLDFGFREPAYYFGNTARPIENLDLACTRPNTVVVEDEELGGQLVRVAPSKCRQVAGVSTRVAIAVMLLGAITVGNQLIAPKFDEADQDGPSSWSYGKRMGYVGVVMGVATFAYGAALLLPTSLQRAGRWCGRLFGRHQQADDIQLNQVVHHGSRPA